MCRIWKNTDVKLRAATSAGRRWFVCLGWTLLPLVCGGQEAAPQNPSINAFESNTLLELIDRAFDAESDSFDPEEGAMNWKGRTFNVGNSRVFRARFERYLDTPDGDLGRDREYQKQLDEIFAKLSTRYQEDRNMNLNEAWSMLFDAADYDADDGNSLVIANMVYNAWRVRDEHRANQGSRETLQRDRRQREDIVANRERMLQQFLDERRRMAVEAGEEPPENRSFVSGSEASFRQRDLAEVEARIQALEASTTLNAQQAKLQFQSQILSFFFQRRFQHALISTSFYRMIFKATAQGLEVGQKEMNDFMPDSDLVPSIESLEFLAREAVADVGAGMAAVDSAYGEGRLVNALQRLQETFFLGEHTPSVQSFPYAKRQNLLRVNQKMNEARKLSDLKDYDQVEILAREIAELAQDFRLQEAISGLRSIRQMSNLALFSAQQGMAAGDSVRAEEGLERAAVMWPLNPALDSFTRELTSKVDISSQASDSFDEKYSQGQYRLIFDQRSDLMPGVFGDEVRGDQMREVMDNVGRVDMLLAQSREMEAQDNRFAAWEMLVAASEIAPDDVLVNREKARMAPGVASFVGALDVAGRQEAQANFAASLSRYLEVRDLYPASRMARQGIERVGEKLMGQIEAANLAPAAGGETPGQLRE